jgi:hypothetical protein
LITGAITLDKDIGIEIGSYLSKHNFRNCKEDIINCSFN